jgi:hypothetical protein
MMPLLQTPLFKIGAGAMAAATAGVAALFLYALNVPTQPEPPAWTTAVIAVDASAPLQVSAASDVR